MSDFVERLEQLTTEKLDELAAIIQSEMRAIVRQHSDTGRERTITTTKVSEHSRFVGTGDRGLYYLDQGSGPVDGKYMGFPEPKGWVDRGNVWNGKVHIYRRRAIEGIHFVREVADRHR